MTARYVVLRAVDRESGEAWGGELVVAGASESAAAARLRRDHPGRRIERKECSSRHAAERLLGLTYGIPDWAETVLWACAGAIAMLIAFGISYLAGWMVR